MRDSRNDCNGFDCAFSVSPPWFSAGPVFASNLDGPERGFNASAACFALTMLPAADVAVLMPRRVRAVVFRGLKLFVMPQM